jgi:ADP-heptose:LPS heptosyltransferase
MNLLSKFSIKNIKYVTFVLVDQCIAAIPKATKSGGVVLIRLDGIGDFVLWLDAAQVLTRHYQRQGRKVSLLANSLWSEWALELGVFDEVISVDIIRSDIDLRYRVRMALNLRKRAFSTALQPSYTRRYLTDFLIHMTGATERVGWTGDDSDIYPWLKHIRDRWYTRLIEADTAPRMEIAINADFVRKVVEPSYLAKMPDLRRLGLKKLDDLLVAELMSTDPFYVLFPGASWTGKRWPAQNFAVLAKRLHDETGWRGMICGGIHDTVLADAICAATDAPLENRAGGTDLSQLTAVLAYARLLVSNDTAATHIAASLGTPTVCVLGGGHYGRFLPYQVEQLDERPLPLTAIHRLPCFNCNWNCIFPLASNGCVPCIEKVDVDDVWGLVRSILAGKQL